jgi:hypothetical protein
MWRFAVSAALLMLLVVLVAEMLFGTSQAPGTVGRHAPPPSWYAVERDALVAGRSSAIDVGRLAAPAGDLTSGPFTEPGYDGPQLGADDQFPELGHLPRQALPGSDELWPDGFPLAAPSHPAPNAAKARTDVIDREPLLPDPLTPDTKQAPRFEVIEAQRQLAALGYSPGPADGRPGRRTESAVRAFQQHTRQPVTGRIDADLLAHLETESRMRAHLRQQELEAMSPAPPQKAEKQKRDRGVFGSVLGGVQRLMGQDFDSMRRPDELSAYCRSNADTWIYDFGREAFVYCGNVLAGQTAAAGAETAGGR